MAAIELSTAGISLKYAVEQTAGTKPSSFTAINGVKSIPEFNPEPNMLDCTPLSATTWKKAIPGLKDVGGALGISVNDYDDFRTSWNAVMTAYSALTAGKAMWFEIYVPGLTGNGGFYFTGVPSELGFGGAEVDAVLENVAYITPNEIKGWDSAL